MKSLPALFRSPMTWLVVLIIVAGIVVVAGSGNDSTDNEDAGETGIVEVAGTLHVRVGRPCVGCEQGLVGQLP